MSAERSAAFFTPISAFTGAGLEDGAELKDGGPEGQA